MVLAIKLKTKNLEPSNNVVYSGDSVNFHEWFGDVAVDLSIFWAGAAKKPGYFGPKKVSLMTVPLGRSGLIFWAWLGTGLGLGRPPAYFTV